MSFEPPEPTPADPEGLRLWQLVDGLGAPFHHERSFRIGRGSLLDHRFLLTVCKRDLGADPRPAVIEIYRRLGMPGDFQATASRFLAGAEYLHFGYERGASSRLYKAYLELPTPAERAAGTAPVLLHLAFKWDAAAGSRSAITRYFWYPTLSVPGMMGRIAAMLPAGGPGEPLDLVARILELADDRLAQGSLRYLEVTEERSPRHSFDVNLYDAGLALDDVSAILERMSRYCDVPADRLRSVMAPGRGRRLGHLAGGMHRAGEEFFSVYYGAERRPGPGRGVST